MVKIKPLTIKIPENTKVVIEGNVVKFDGAKGSTSQIVHGLIKVAINDGEIVIERTSDDKKTRALHGLVKALLTNAVIGVNSGFTKTLEMAGVGYKAVVAGDELTLSVGFSHPVKFTAPASISFAAAENKITVTGVDKHLVGQVAHSIRAVRPPEPYKGKGIKYQGERIRRKAGKAAAKTVGAK